MGVQTNGAETLCAETLRAEPPRAERIHLCTFEKNLRVIGPQPIRQRCNKKV